MGDTRAVVPLLDTLKDENGFVKKSAVTSLEKFNIFKK